MKKEDYIVIRYSIGSVLNDETNWYYAKVTARKRSDNDKRAYCAKIDYKAFAKTISKEEALELIKGMPKVLDTKEGRIWDSGNFLAKYGKNIYIPNTIGL